MRLYFLHSPVYNCLCLPSSTYSCAYIRLLSFIHSSISVYIVRFICVHTLLCLPPLVYSLPAYVFTFPWITLHVCLRAFTHSSVCLHLPPYSSDLLFISEVYLFSFPLISLPPSLIPLCRSDVTFLFHLQPPCHLRSPFHVHSTFLHQPASSFAPISPPFPYPPCVHTHSLSHSSTVPSDPTALHQSRSQRKLDST